MIKIIEPKTKRLQLRQWKPSDYPAFSAMSADPEVMKYFPSTLNQSQSTAIAHTCQSLINKNGWGVWAVELSATQTFIGMVGLHLPSAKLPCSPCVEIIWRLAQPYWGQGYATEAAKAALNIGFEQLNLSQIVSFTVLHNHPSRAVMQKLGLKDSGENFEHPNVPVGSHLRKHCLYKISRESWLQRTL